MDPCLVVTRLILVSQTQLLAVDPEAPTLADQPFSLRDGVLHEAANVSPSMRDTTRAPQRRGARWQWEPLQGCHRFSVPRQLFVDSWCSHNVDIYLNHGGADRPENVERNAASMGNCIVEMQGHPRE